MNSSAVANFVHHETALLDGRRLEEWLALFAADGLLWVPGRSGDADPTRHVSIIFDRLPQLRGRVGRLLSGKETAQDPPSNTIRAVTNLTHSGGADGQVVADAVMTIYETRGLNTDLLILPARVHYVLRPTGADAGKEAGFEIVEKRLDLLEVHRHFHNLAFLL